MLSNEDFLHIFHEIKNSITLVNGSLQLVAQKHPEVCNFDYWNEAMSEIHFLKNMVTQLSATRLCSQLKQISVNIYSFMNQISASVHAFSEEYFNFEIILEENLPLVYLDPHLFRQALINIIKNAYEASGNGNVPVRIHVFSKGSLLHIAISDCAGGLDPAIADSIFHPFITSKAGGSGLGLVITKQIVECHNGTIACESRLGDGCTFTITLPILQEVTQS
ncbi:MAG: ATP-binding protein [Clostridiales bacterium]|nr:ATP-binding protein [Clostridiales bacterium]